MGDVNNSSGIGGWLKKALYNPTDVQNPIAQTPIPTPIPKRMPIPKVVVQQQPQVQQVQIDDGELDTQYINHLSDFMEKNNQAGPDYLEFARSLDEMISEMEGASEEKIFKMTYKVGYRQNLPVTKLVESAGIYISLFNLHKKEFSGYLDSENQKIVGSKVNENNTLTKTNTDSLKKIEELKSQIQSLETTVQTNSVRIEENNTIIDTETANLENRKFKFEKAFSFVVGKINDDIQKIGIFLAEFK
jgi:flagellar basal body rod protein FlgB